MGNLNYITAVQWSIAPNVPEALNRVSDRFPFRDYLDRQIPGCVNISKAILRHLPPAKTTRVLDFGCGACEKAAVISALGYQCSGYDDLGDDWHKMPGNREAIEKFAATMGVEFRLASGGEYPWGPKTFDLIMLNDVVEHLHNSPRTLLNSLLQLLKEDGLLLITVPNAVNIRKRMDVLFGRTNLQKYELFYWYPDPWRGHVREYTKGDLRLLSQYLGLSLVELRSCDNMLRRIPQLLRPAYLGMTEMFRGWKDTWLLVAKKKKGWEPVKMSREELSRLLTDLGAGAYPSDSEISTANSA